MAYMNQEKKAKIAAELKKIIPPTWKWSLAVRHHSTIRLCISAAPIDLIGKHLPSPYLTGKETYLQLNEYHLEHAYEGVLLETFKRIKDAMNTDNFDKSDIMTDYFHVGHYVDINIGRWDKPFEYIRSYSIQPQPGDAEYERLKARLAELHSAHTHDFVLQADDSRLCACGERR